MPILIKNATLLQGRDLKFVEKGNIQISDKGIITRVGTDRDYTDIEKKSSIFDAEGFLLLPGLINAHTHIGDSIAKDITSDPDLSCVDPRNGIKNKILTRTNPNQLEVFMRNSAISMQKRGIVAFADFREGGLNGVTQLRRAVSGLKIKTVVLGRIENYFDPSYSNKTVDSNGSSLNSQELLHKIYDVLEISDGLGISGTNENTDESLIRYSKSTRDYSQVKISDTKRLLAIHAAESHETASLSIQKTGLTEVERIIKFLKPDFVIHMTKATDNDITSTSTNKIGIVVCPRSNGVMGCGIPRIADMLNKGCVVAIGTDNVMLNSPDIFKEMDYLWKVSRASGVRSVSARDILRMATVNGAEILHLNSGCIEAGRCADMLFVDKRHIDLFPIHDPYASIVQRVDQESIKGVMIDGEFVTEAGISG
jgi:cytosine/adenosine deaminase-related metal-dependent hydrolase